MKNLVTNLKKPLSTASLAPLLLLITIWMYKYREEFFLCIRYFVIVIVATMRMFVSSIFVCVLLATLTANIQAYKTYSKHQLWRLHVTNNEQVGKMLQFRQYAHIHDINFWSDEFRINIPVSQNDWMECNSCLLA